MRATPLDRATIRLVATDFARITTGSDVVPNRFMMKGIQP